MTNPELSTTAVTTGPTNTPAVDTPILPIVLNPQGYPPFDLRLLSTYMNNQLRYYYISGVILNVDEEELAKQLNKRKAALKAVNWDRDTRENTLDASISAFTLLLLPPSTSRTFSLNDDNEPTPNTLRVNGRALRFPL